MVVTASNTESWEIGRSIRTYDALVLPRVTKFDPGENSHPVKSVCWTVVCVGNAGNHTADTDFQVTSSQRQCLCVHAQKVTSVLVAILKKDGNFFQLRIICPKTLTWRLILKTGKVKYEL